MPEVRIGRAQSAHSTRGVRGTHHRKGVGSNPGRGTLADATARAEAVWPKDARDAGEPAHCEGFRRAPASPCPGIALRLFDTACSTSSLDGGSTVSRHSSRNSLQRQLQVPTEISQGNTPGHSDISPGRQSFRHFGGGACPQPTIDILEEDGLRPGFYLNAECDVPDEDLLDYRWERVCAAGAFPRAKPLGKWSWFGLGQ